MVKRSLSSSVNINSTRTIVALTAIIVIVLIGLCGILIEKYWKKSLSNLFKIESNKKHFNPWFQIKRYFLYLILFIINMICIAIIYLFGGQQGVIVVIIILKIKDILCAIILPFYNLYKTYSLYDYNRPILNGNQKTIVSIVPVYKEKLDEISYTIDSIIHNSFKLYRLLIVIISDGNSTDVDSVLNKTVKSQTNIEYNSWKDENISCDIIYGYRHQVPVVIIKKEINMEKKDSLILSFDLFNSLRNDISTSTVNFRKLIRKEIKHLYRISKYDYMFFTDADSFIRSGSLTRLIDEMEYRHVGAACGIVMVDFNNHFGGFWNLYQNYQYLYGQILRRSFENIFRRLTCLPGCITMIKVDQKFSYVTSDYAKMPRQSQLIHTTVQRLGTDRRLAYLIQYHKIKTCMVESAVCYTKPPHSLYRFLTQRRRWGSNAFFNSLLGVCSSRIHPIIRLSLFLDMARMALVYFRLFNIALFIYQLTQHVQLIQLIIQVFIVLYPTFYFFISSFLKAKLRRIYPKLVLGYILNKLCTSLISVAVITTVFYNVGNLSWGGPKKNVKNTSDLPIFTIQIV
ncbi:unnamed protein product [Adineta ricciae]|uniref:chitin synthase n=1 Tax=Adineta ricciae TaxID=249248 RepID=A0A815T387_ADIRI|nr:unnamed protein product [Adineta ricciae]